MLSRLKSLLSPPKAEAPSAARDVRQAEELKNRGNQHLAGAEYDAAAECYRQAIRANPDYAEAYNNLGYVCRQQNRLVEAECYLVQAVALNSDLGQAQFNLGQVIEDLGRGDEAIVCYERAIGALPSFLDSYLRLAHVHVQRQDYGAAEAVLMRGIAVEPQFPDAYANIAGIHLVQNRFDEAETYCRKSLSMAENFAAYGTLGGVCLSRGQWRQACTYYGKACALNPQDFITSFNYGLLLLLTGDYEKGLARLEGRLTAMSNKEHWLAQVQLYMPRLGEEKLWHGEDLEGGRILLWAENGIGDTLMMLRYLPMLRSRGAGQVWFQCQRSFTELMQSFPEIDRIIPETEIVSRADCDWHCSIMSLPYLFGTRVDTIPNAVPYLRVLPDKHAHWRMCCGGLPGLKVGLVWAGNPLFGKDGLRSISLVEFAPLMEIPGISWISVQKGERADELAELGWPLLTWIEECDDLTDSAALVANLDLVISVDTAMAHLAGALAKPVWMLNRFESEWRWMIGREDSPWYPSMRIFTQSVRNEWGDVIERVAIELHKWRRSGGPGGNQ